MATSKSSQVNVDETGYNFMAKLADTWWDKSSGPMHTLHSMNSVRVSFVCDQLEKYGKIKSRKSLAGVKILDVGCGAGIYSEALAKIGATVVGLDPVEALIESAKNHLNSQELIKDKVKYYSETIEEHIKKYPNAYDVVVCSEVMEHVESKKALSESCMKALKPGGDFFMTTPNKTFSSYICVILISENFGIIEKGGHQWSWFIHHNDMKKMLYSVGLRTVKLKGLTYYPIFKKWKITNMKFNNYILHAMKVSF